LLSACATPGDAMKSWIGHTQEDVIAKWGNPTYTTTDGSGGKILVYEKYVDWNQIQGGSTQPSYQMARRMLFVDPQGVVYRWRDDSP
jgi:hypothetical protein